MASPPRWTVVAVLVPDGAAAAAGADGWNSAPRRRVTLRDAVTGERRTVAAHGRGDLAAIIARFDDGKGNHA